MACGCSGKCSCVIQGGQGVVVRGLGTKASPYVLDAAGTIVTVQNGNGIEMTLAGQGTPTAPYVVRADLEGSFPFIPVSHVTWDEAEPTLAGVQSPSLIVAEVEVSLTDITLPDWPVNVAGAIRVLLAPTEPDLTWTVALPSVEWYPDDATGELTNAALLEFTWDGQRWGYTVLSDSLTGDFA